MHPSIRERRDALGWSLSMVARRVEVSEDLLAAAERGSCGLDAAQRERVCAVLGIGVVERFTFVCLDCR
jgi:ribosome-binding protein aMBF1 (putative translation factor)